MELLTENELLYEKMMKLNDALLSNKGINYILDIAYELLGNPCFLGDVRYQLIAASGSNVDDPNWEYIISNGCCDPDLLRKIMNKEVEKKIITSDGIISMRYEGSKYTWYSIHIKLNSNFLADFSVIEYNKPCSELDLKIIAYLKKVLLCELQKSKYQEIQYKNKYESFLFNLINQSCNTQKKLEDAKFYCNVKLKNNFYIMVVQPMPKTLLPAQVLQKQLEDLLSCYYSIVLDKTIIFLLSIDDELPYSKSKEKELIRLLEFNKYSAAISQRFNNLLLTSSYYHESLLTIELVDKFRLNQSLTYFDDPKIYPFSLFKAGYYSPEVFCHPDFKKIIEYDKKNNTNLVQTLKLYLQSGQNISKTAQSSFVHRNTIDYRIKKIEEIIDASVSNIDILFTLYISLKSYLLTEVE